MSAEEKQEEEKNEDKRRRGGRRTAGFSFFCFLLLLPSFVIILISIPIVLRGDTSNEIHNNNHHSDDDYNRLKHEKATPITRPARSAHPGTRQSLVSTVVSKSLSLVGRAHQERSGRWLSGAPEGSEGIGKTLFIHSRKPEDRPTSTP